MSVLSLIIQREFISKVRNKSFIIMTFLSPLIFVAVALLITYLSTLRTEVKTIAIHDETGWFYNQFEPDETYRYVDVSAVPKSVLLDSVQSKIYDGILFIPKMENVKDYEKSVEYISEDSPNSGFISHLERTLSQKFTAINRVQNHIDTLALSKSVVDVNLNLHKASGEETIKGLNEIKVFIGGAFGYLIMMFIIIYGNMVMRSVIEEKTNRIIEVIVSSVKPKQLMLGKIIGTTLAGILQFLIWSVLGVVLLTGISYFFGINPLETQASTLNSMSIEGDYNIQLYVKEILSLPLFSLFFYFLIYFIGGYFLYSSLYAAIGAAVDNETDTQQFMFPVIMPLMLGVYIGFFTVIHEPHGTVATVFSMIPFTSPIVMLMRIPFGVPFYQILLSILILITTFMGIVWFASKIYRIGILMYGKKPTWKELIKWMKY